MSDSNKSRPTIGVGVLVWRDEQLLLGKRISKGHHSCWQFPGGHLENGESVLTCAHREVLEETGLKVKQLRHLGFTDKPFEIAQRSYITLLVSCVYESGEAQTLEPDKCEQWQWFDYHQLPEPLFEPINIFMLQHKNLYTLHCTSTVMPNSSLTAGE
jgi:8-oxo-dGTP diphosphatase